MLRKNCALKREQENGMGINWHANMQKKYISSLLYDNKYYTDRTSIRPKLNDHFINVGPKQAAQLLSIQAHPTKSVKHTTPSNFNYRGIIFPAVSDMIKNPKVNKACLGAPADFITLACGHISEAFALVFHSLEQGNFLDNLKVSKRTSVDDTNAPTYFEPLCAFTEIFEILVHKQHYKYSNLSEYQF